jgi:hypothetical protein
VAIPTLRAEDDVTVRPPRTKSTCQRSPIWTTAVRSMLVRDAVPVVIPMVTGCSGSVASWKFGCFGRSPWKCPIRTPITPGAGEKNVTVTIGRLRVSPRLAILPIGANTVRVLSVRSTVSTPPGCRTLTPWRSSQ